MKHSSSIWKSCPCDKWLSNPVSLVSDPIEISCISMYLGKIEVRDVGVETIKILEANYPESLRRVFIINGKKIWTNVYPVLSFDY